jgi:hypothetical protein
MASGIKTKPENFRYKEISRTGAGDAKKRITALSLRLCVKSFL